MDFFNELFGTLIFTKVKIVGTSAVYAARIQSFIGVGERYVFLTTELFRNLPDQVHIYQVPWTSLQTRTITDHYALKEQALSPKTFDPRYSDFKLAINVLYREQTQTIYTCRYPFEIMLLHDPKKKSTYQYSNAMDLRHALGTFQCVVKNLES